ncbi:hypothetical protein [Clostridium perfringens]|uniref:Uncharacterized protein n=1 Tax=Clostridium perfringens E str. JGS1987 TaxID=451755 RepID=B1BR24_CLOPF|nr:hypothetical protein [Clostridium perfringens]EDT15803.1 hypothetical protein AC3_A0152 [Clostridium perfringens E str. JGS1987]
MNILTEFVNILANNPFGIVGIYILLAIIIAIYSIINLKEGTFVNLIVSSSLIGIPVMIGILSIAIGFNIFNLNIPINWIYFRDKWIEVLNNTNTIVYQVIIFIAILGRNFMDKIIKDFKLTKYYGYNFFSIAIKNMLRFVCGATSLIFLNAIIWGNEIQIITLIAILCLSISDIVDVFDKCPTNILEKKKDSVMSPF